MELSRWANKILQTLLFLARFIIFPLNKGVVASFPLIYTVVERSIFPSFLAAFIKGADFQRSLTCHFGSFSTGFLERVSWV